MFPWFDPSRVVLSGQTGQVDNIRENILALTGRGARRAPVSVTVTELVAV